MMVDPLVTRAFRGRRGDFHRFGFLLRPVLAVVRVVIAVVIAFVLGSRRLSLLLARRRLRLGSRRVASPSRRRRCVVANPVSAFERYHVATLVEEGAVVTHHALLEGPHKPVTVVRNPVSAVEAHLPVVSPVPVAHPEARCIELGKAVVALVAGDLAQHAARDVPLVLPARGCRRNRRDASLCIAAAVSALWTCFVGDYGPFLRVHIPQVVIEVSITGHAVV